MKFPLKNRLLKIIFFSNAYPLSFSESKLLKLRWSWLRLGFFRRGFWRGDVEPLFSDGTYEFYVKMKFYFLSVLNVSLNYENLRILSCKWLFIIFKLLSIPFLQGIKINLLKKFFKFISVLPAAHYFYDSFSSLGTSDRSSKWFFND